MNMWLNYENWLNKSPNELVKFEDAFVVVAAAAVGAAVSPDQPLPFEPKSVELMKQNPNAAAAVAVVEVEVEVEVEALVGC